MSSGMKRTVSIAGALRATPVLLAAAIMAVWTLGCEDKGVNSGGGASNNTCTSAGACKTVTIGGVTWMAENLNIKTKGSCCLNENESYCKKYGRLYEWETAMAVCPAGWHLSTVQEWDALVEYVGGQEVAGKKLKAKKGWKWNNYYDKDGSGTDDIGFSALPGLGFGCGYGEKYEGEYDNSSGYWWMAGGKDDYNAYFKPISYISDGAGGANIDEAGMAYSVRCVMD